MRTTIKKWQSIAGYLVALSLVLGVTPVAMAAPPTFTQIDVPGAIETRVEGINPAGDIVGSFTDGSVMHGFLRSR